MLLGSLLLSLAGVSPAGAQAQNYPNRAVRIIIGPSPDVFARIVGQHLQDTWHHPVVVEPRTGAGGQIAASTVASAEPDGHTLLFATPSYTLNTAMKTANYDLLKQFDPAALFGVIAYVLVVHPSVQAKSVPELIALAKAQPGKLNCASAGIGTVPHLACETLNKIPGVNVVHVPYRNVNEAMNGLVAGHVQLFVSVSTVARQQMQGGTVRGLAVTSAQRSQLLPNLPTLAESGYPDFVMPGWGGLLATAGTPKDVVAKINAEVGRAVAKPEIAERLAAVGMEAPPPLDAAGVAGFIKDDIARWTRLVEAVGIDKLREGSKP
jgi:tripartite-type tricarboxylate transporter receptor subunit TctC